MTMSKQHKWKPNTIDNMLFSLVTVFCPFAYVFLNCKAMSFSVAVALEGQTGFD